MYGCLDEEGIEATHIMIKVTLEPRLCPLEGKDQKRLDAMLSNIYKYTLG
jgi:hypothetical protein